MVKLWSSSESIFDCDATGMCPFYLSLQHEEVYKIVTQFINPRNVHKYDPKYWEEMTEWYERIGNCDTIYGLRATSYTDCIEFLEQSVLYKDSTLWSPTVELFDSLIAIMNEFSRTISSSAKYSFLAFNAEKSGSLREGTKTFVPNEADITCVAQDTTGLKINDSLSSQSSIQVLETHAHKNWLRVCRSENILCPQKLEVEFCDAMEYAFENTHIPSPFSAGKFSLQRKDKISCFRLLYRNDVIKDVVVSVDFVFAFPHPKYTLSKRERELAVDDAVFYLIPKVSLRKTTSPENAHFLVSYSDIESKFILNLPDTIRVGYIYAKAARSPKLFTLPNHIACRLLEPFCIEEIVTTYMLKTCLMNELTSHRCAFLISEASPYDVAYSLYRHLRNGVKTKGKLAFFFDRSINLVHCEHHYDIDYDDKLGCCLKRMLIVEICEAIMVLLKSKTSKPMYR